MAKEFDNDLQQLGNKILVVPYINDFTRAQHKHDVASGGGEINLEVYLSDTVVEEISFGQASSSGSSALASRNDHTHGTPVHYYGRFYPDSGIGHIQNKANITDSEFTWIWPATYGTNDQVFTTDGTGGITLTDKGSGGTASGIASLNSQTGATQTFINDSNVAIASSADQHVLTWIGDLPFSRFQQIITASLLGRATTASGDVEVLTNIPTGITIGSAYIYRAGGTDIPVTDGGTGVSTLTTAYGLLAAGTTATGTVQTLSAGATTTILVGGGTSALPVWTTATGTGAPVKAGSPTFTGIPIAPTIALTNLTDGYLPYHVSDAVGLANSGIYTDGTNVGIGTTSPGGKFHVFDDGTAVVAGTFEQTGVSGFGVRIRAGGTASGRYGLVIRNAADNVDYFRVLSETGKEGETYIKGNVGIGTTGPNAKLESLSTTEQLRVSYDSTHYASFTTNSAGALALGNNGADHLILNQGGYLTILPNATITYFMGQYKQWLGSGSDVNGMIAVYPAKLYFGANGNSYANIGMTLDNTTGTSLVGIGTTSPGSKVDVKGTLRLTASDGTYSGFYTAAGTTSKEYRLPTADGSNTNVMMTDGAGNLSWTTTTGMVYPGAGIALSTGTAWGTSITNNSANWNTAYGWGNHAGLYSLLAHTHSGFSPIRTYGVTISNPTATMNVIVWRAPFSCTVTNVRGYRVGGSGATVNARRNGSSNHLASNLSLTSADTYMDGGSVQNTTYIAGDKLEVMVVSQTGNPTQVAVQVDFTVL